MKTNSEALKKARILPRMELLEAGILRLQEDLKRATEKRKQPAQTPKSADVVGANKSAEQESGKGSILFTISESDKCNLTKLGSPPLKIKELTTVQTLSREDGKVALDQVDSVTKRAEVKTKPHTKPSELNDHRTDGSVSTKSSLVGVTKILSNKDQKKRGSLLCTTHVVVGKSGDGTEK